MSTLDASWTSTVHDPSKEVAMFDHVCSSCGKRQLIFPSQVTSLVNTDHGIEVTHTCWCGAEQAWLTGRAAATQGSVEVAA
jgi:hypothetical protein